MRESSATFIQSTWHFNWCGLRLFACQFNAQAWQPSDEAFLCCDAYQSLQRAAPKRKAEFVAGRLMAMKALAYIDKPTMDIEIGQHRAPIWPSGVVGSISHHSSIAMSCATLANHYCCLGLDIETVIPESQAQQIQALVCNDDELALQPSSGLSLAEFVTLLFSAKESLFKAVYPRLKRYLEFSDARLIAFNSQSLTLELVTAELRACYNVAYQTQHSSMITLVYGR